MRAELAAALDRIVARAVFLDRSAKWQHSAFGHRIGLEWMTCASDGHVILAISGGNLSHATGAPDISYIFAEPRAEWFTASLAAVLTELGPEPAQPPCTDCGGTGQRTCDECDGTKVVEHQCDCRYCHADPEEDCDECEGTGKVLCGCTETPHNAARPKWSEACVFFGLPMDARLLRRSLPALDETVTIGVAADRMACTVVGDGWAAVLMGLREAPDDAPRIPSPPSAASAKGEP